jgi:hypothetical protein
VRVRVRVRMRVRVGVDVDVGVGVCVRDTTANTCSYASTNIGIYIVKTYNVFKKT